MGASRNQEGYGARNDVPCGREGSEDLTIYLNPHIGAPNNLHARSPLEADPGVTQMRPTEDRGKAGHEVQTWHSLDPTHVESPIGYIGTWSYLHSPPVVSPVSYGDKEDIVAD